MSHVSVCPEEYSHISGAHPVLTSDCGRLADRGVGRVAGLWPLPPPSPPPASWTEPPPRGDQPDSGESRAHLYGGESLPRVRATQGRGCGGRCVRPTSGAAM